MVIGISVAAVTAEEVSSNAKSSPAQPRAKIEKWEIINKGKEKKIKGGGGIKQFHECHVPRSCLAGRNEVRLCSRL
jgi:hypothetical protein